MSGELLDDAAPPPDTSEYKHLLKWAAGALPVDHPDLGFLCSLLAQCLTRPGLTHRQVRYADRILDRLLAEAGERVPYDAADVDLRALAPAGEA